MTDAVLEPLTVVVSYRGEDLSVTPLKIGQIPPFLRAVRPMLGTLAGTSSEAFELDILGMIADHGEALFVAASVATGKPLDWIDKGEADEFVTLVKAVLEVNADFFAKRVAPLLAGATLVGIGQTQSST